MANKITQIKVGTTTYDVAVPEGYIYSGVAHINTPTFTPTQNSFYIATEVGTYNGFGGLTVATNEVAIFKFDTSWSKDVTGIPSKGELAELASEVDELGSWEQSRRFIEVKTDGEGKILFTRDTSGKYNFYTEIIAPNMPTEVQENGKYVEVTLDAEGKVVKSLDKNGVFVCNLSKDLSTPTKLRIASYNTGDFVGNGIERGSEEAMLEYRRAIAEIHADILVTQMDDNYVDVNGTMLAKDFIFAMFTNRYFTDYVYSSTLTEHMGVCSNYPFLSVESKTYSQWYGHKLFQKGYVVINGKKIAIYNIHLPWKDKNVRRQNIAQLIQDAQNDEYVVFIGDYNPDNAIEGEPQGGGSTYAEDLQIFKDAGYVPANAGYLGVYTTYDLEDTSVKYPCDNIVLSPNITIQKFGMVVKGYMNDHFIVYSDIVIN